MRERFIRLHSLNEASLEERRDRHTAATGKQTRHDRPAKELNVTESAFILEDCLSTRNKICFIAVEHPVMLCDNRLLLLVSKVTQL